MPPTLGQGKICYLEIPAVDIDQSIEFYRHSFGWVSRRRTDGSTAFDDGVNEVSGTWVLGRPPATEPGLLVYIMVEDAIRVIEQIVSAGGTIVQPIGGDPGEITARFRDPAGNVLGIYQSPA